jgi:hypothetical protein
MKMRSFLSQISMSCLGIAVATLSFGGNPAHAGPEPEGSIKGSPVGPMGTVSDKVEMNLKRAEAAKRLKERRAAAAATKKKDVKPIIIKEVPNESSQKN